jgi:titin
MASAKTPSSSQQAPDAPIPLTATPVSTSQIDLNWANVSNENGYRVERSEDGVNFSLLATPGAETTSYDDTGRLPGTLYYYRVTAFNAGGDSDPASASAETLQDSSQELEYALADVNVHGTVSSNYTSTWYDDGSVQQILEDLSGGKKRNRTSRLEHRWRFDLNPATSAMVIANAWKSGFGVDDFVFEYSTDGSNFSPLFAISGIGSQDETLTHAALLPNGLSGPVYLRVKDTDRSAGRTALDSIHVDQLVIQIENGSVILPVAPSNFRSTDVTALTIRLAWNDNSDNESGFTIERNTDGSNVYPWSDTVGPGSETYDDHSVSAQTLYYYRVNAFNSAGSSAATGAIAVETPAGGIDLTATGHKRKGRNVIELSWTGTAGETMEINRNGSVIDSTSGSIYTHVTGDRGSRTYTYRVCRLGTTDCSDTEQVIF